MTENALEMGKIRGLGEEEYERNPYYYKVDIEGNQLPYIDSLVSHEVLDLETITMRVLTGEMVYNRAYTALNQMPVYRENEERGDYTTHVLEHHCPTVLTLNLTFEDPVWQEVVQDRRFRQALNMAIDREEIIDSIYFGFAEPARHVPHEYDLSRAEELLDEMGMDERDSDGFRKSPDGEPFELFIEYPDWAPDFTPMAELLVEHFREIGIDTDMRLISDELRGIRGPGNELMATLGWLHSELWSDEAYRDYLPNQHWPGQWGPEWGIWYATDGEEGVRPPDYVLDMYDRHEAVLAEAPHTPEGLDAMDDLLDWHYEEIVFFLPAESVGYPMTAANNLGNIPTSGYAIAANRSGEEFFFRDAE